jgi:hypothetical protein
MRTSLVIAAMVAAGASATGAGAVHFATSPFNGSDTEFDLINLAMQTSGLGTSGDYAGGGSGAGENNMTAATPKQWTGPMSKMLTNVSCNTTSFTYPVAGAAAEQTHASGLVFALDALDILSSTTTGGSANCNTHSSDGTDTTHGVAATTTLTFSGGSITFKNWTDVLALLYGGLDKSQSPKVTDCNSPQRQALIANWNNLFQASASTCTNSSACTTATYQSCAEGGTCASNLAFKINNVLWHAFRRDDNSGTSDVFSSLIGITTIFANPPATTPSVSGGKLVSSSGAAISYAVSASKLNGYGVSPFCNAMNWDTTGTANGTTCAQGVGHQYVGPGGIAEPTAGLCTADGSLCNPQTTTTCGSGGTGTCMLDGYHRRPPPGVWGDLPGAVFGAVAWPTSYQDNDPVRHPCLGAATIVGQGAPAEEVCNTDGQLGTVIPIPPVDWVAQAPISQNPFPTAQCSAVASGALLNAHKCAPQGAPNEPVCADGHPAGAACQVVATAQKVNGGVTACENNPKLWPGKDGATKDGRIFNLTLMQATNATFGAPVNYAIPGTTFSVNFSGAFARIHEAVPIWDTSVTATPPNLPGTTQPQQGCQMTDATDQIGCLVQADPCSVGYAGDGGRSWNTHEGLSLASSGNDALQLAGLSATGTTIGGIYPTVADIQLAGAAASYPAWRKLYINSSKGFDAVDGTTVLTANTATSDLALAQWLANTANVAGAGGVDTLTGFFSLGPNAGAGTLAAGATDQPFCEDYNEALLCAASSNANGCTTNANQLQPGNSLSAPSTLGLTTANFKPIPSLSTTCGDGTKDPFEDCDNGLSNGTSGNACSNTCRFVLN